MSDIEVKFATNPPVCPVRCPYGIQADSLLEHFNIPSDAIAAVRVNNEIRPTKTHLAMNCALSPVLLDSPEGSMIYRRSLAFILAIAARKLFPERGLYVGHSLGNSYYYTFNTGGRPTEQDVAGLKDEMTALVQENLPITFKYLAYEDALEVFRKNRQTDTVLLLEHRSSSRIKVNECRGFMDIYVEPLVPRTGLIATFDLCCYEDGFLLSFPGTGTDNIVDPFIGEQKIFRVYEEYKKWGRIVGVRVAGELNALVSNRTVRDFIRIAEAFQSRKLAEIAEHIYAKRDTVKMVLLAGPSSSGKTTSAKRLSIELRVMGITPLAISLDDYYVGRERTPQDENGNPDYECLEALDIPFLNEQLLALYRGDEITLPVYDFKTSSRREGGGKKLRMDRRTILIVEGIHALNDKLTPSIKRDTEFKLYVSALTQLNLDDHNRISTSDNRLLRRIVRDNQFRYKDAAGTLKMWPGVQAGERKHIFPFQNTADATFNSALDYELSVLKYYADPLLREVKPTMYEYAEAVRLLTFLENFAPIPPQYVPGASILREFIGESEFKY
jgi:uridine kinase